MRALGVVVHLPCLDYPYRRRQRWEQVLVQTLVAQATVKAFDDAVLLRLSWCYVVPLDPCDLASGKDGVTGQFGAPFDPLRTELSLTTMHGSPRRSAMAVNARMTRRPDNDKSTMHAGHSRL